MALNFLEPSGAQMATCSPCTPDHSIAWLGMACHGGPLVPVRVKGYLLFHNLSLVLELKYEIISHKSIWHRHSIYDRLTADTNSRVFVANGERMSREGMFSYDLHQLK